MGSSRAEEKEMTRWIEAGRSGDMIWICCVITRVEIHMCVMVCYLYNDCVSCIMNMTHDSSGAHRSNVRCTQEAYRGEKLYSVSIVMIN